jgi:surface antigen
MRRVATSLALVAALVAAGCEQSGYGTKQTIGGLGGAALGGLLGAQFGAGTGRLITTGAGVLIGGLVGSEIGRQMDVQDRQYANAAINRAYDAPIGSDIDWNNPESGNYGTITPVRDGTSASGQYCREFQQTITIGGRREQGVGVACRQPDGTWRIVQ